MKKRLKRLSMLLGAVMLFVCQNGVLARAEENIAEEASAEEQASEEEADAATNQESKDADRDNDEKQAPVGEVDVAANQESKGTDRDSSKEQDSVNTEIANPQEEDTGKESAGTDTKAAVSAKAEDLKWDERQKGQASFKIPNEKKTASYTVTLWCDGQRLQRYAENKYGDYEKGATVDLFFFHDGYITKSGLYKFDVTTLDVNGNPVNQVFSEERRFTLSADLQLSKPYDVSWKEDGTFSCKRADEENFKQYEFEVYDSNGTCVARFGSPVIENKTETKEGISFDLNAYLKKAENVAPENGFRITVRATSKDFEVCRNSECAEAVLGGETKKPDSTDKPSSDSQNSTKENEESEPVVVKGWEPTTPDEIKRYSFYSREKVNFTTDQGNAYGVTIKNAMQGRRCFDSFEAVLEDYQIGRTYSILPSDKYIYEMDSKARITLTIPKALQADGRVYRMICVTEKGKPIVLEDLDATANTITFETDTYYAFALVYKDASVSK